MSWRAVSPKLVEARQENVKALEKVKEPSERVQYVRPKTYLLQKQFTSTTLPHFASSIAPKRQLLTMKENSRQLTISSATHVHCGHAH